MFETDTFGRRPIFCKDHTATVSFFITILTISVVLFLFFAIKWIRNRNFFPVRERSRWLTLISAFGFITNLLMYPIAYLMCNYSNVCDKGTGVTNAISIVLIVTSILMFLPYFFRLFRLYLVFQTNSEGRFFFFINKGESFWIILLTIVTAGTAIAIYFTKAETYISNFLTLYENDNQDEQRIKYFWVCIHTAENLLLLVFIFALRNVPKEYQLHNELMGVFLSNFFCTNLIEGLLFLGHESISTLKCPGDIPVLLFLNNINYYLLFYFTIIKPVLQSTPDHLHMAPMLVLQGELNFVLKDEVCWVPFYKFAKHREEQEQFTRKNYLLMGTPKKPLIFPQTLLHFLMRVELIEREKQYQSEPLKKLVEDSIVNEERPIFPQKIREAIFHSYQDENKEWDLEDISVAYSYAYNILNQLYLNEYRFTASYFALKRNLERYEHIYRRLNLFKMM